MEVLIALSVFAIILFAIYTSFESSRSTYAAGEQKADIQQNARIAMELMGTDLRLAGFGFPTGVGNAITAANATSITFWGDVTGASTTICNPDVGAGITTFNVQDASGIQAGDTIYLINGGQSETRTVQSVNITPDPDPTQPCNTPDTITITAGTGAAYPWGSQVGRPRSVAYSWAGNTVSKDDGEGGGLQPLADTIQNLQLQYFDANDVPIATPVTAGNLPNIRRITITVAVQSPAGWWRQQDFTIASDIRPRNL
jgi:hypothetical protein